LASLRLAEWCVTENHGTLWLFKITQEQKPSASLHSASKNLCSFPLPQQPASAALDAERTTAKLNGKQVIEIDED